MPIRLRGELSSRTCVHLFTRIWPVAWLDEAIANRALQYIIQMRFFDAYPVQTVRLLLGSLLTFT
jgi:hypothetical protein